MIDPVIALDGHSYERDAITQWFGQGRIKSPLTNAPLGSRHLTPNHTLRKGKSVAHHHMPLCSPFYIPFLHHHVPPFIYICLVPSLAAAIENFLTNEMPHLRDQQSRIDNLEAAIKLREADLAAQTSKRKNAEPVSLSSLIQNKVLSNSKSPKPATSSTWTNMWGAKKRGQERKHNQIDPSTM